MPKKQERIAWHVDHSIGDCKLPKQDINIVRIIKRVHMAVGYYPARFPYGVAFSFMEWLGGASRILDPFVGSGVACTAARLRGHECIGFDINPFALLLARVSSSTINTKDEEMLARILQEMESYQGPGWRPRWKNIEYWHPPVVLEVLERLWGYVHGLGDNNKLYLLILRVALARISRLFSYADPEIPKLYRGRGVEKLEVLIRGKTPGKIRELILSRIREHVFRIVRALREYTSLGPTGPKPRLENLDTVREPFPQDLDRIDAVFTSPPYLAAHEYTRSTKLELYWLGHSDNEIRSLRNREIPYGPVEPYKVESDTYNNLEKIIASNAPKLLGVYRRYFWAITRALDKATSLDPRFVALFVGPATIASIPVPIHEILSEHLSIQGYTPLCQRVSAIRIRKLFRGRNNRNPEGISSEILIILNKVV